MSFTFNHSAPHCMGSSPGLGKNFHVRRTSSWPAVHQWFYSYILIFQYLYVWGLTPPVKAGSRHMTLKVSMWLKKINKQTSFHHDLYDYIFVDDEEWELLSQGKQTSHSPGSRYGHSAVVYNKQMWLYGGMTDLQPKQDLWCYTFSMFWNVIFTTDSVMH